MFRSPVAPIGHPKVTDGRRSRVRDTNKVFAERLRRTRENLKLSTRQLAKLSGVSKKQIVCIEAGWRRTASGRERDSYLGTVEHLADALGVPPKWLVGWESQDLAGLIEISVRDFRAQANEYAVKAWLDRATRPASQQVDSTDCGLA